MRILNVMFNKELGGVEHVFLRTTMLFQSWGWDVRTLTHTHAKINDALGSNVPLDHQLRLSPSWLLTLHARLKVRAFVQREKIDRVLIHNGKYAQFVCNSLSPWCRAHRPNLSLIGYCHGTAPQNLAGMDHVITLTKKMHQQFHAAGHAPEHLSLIPHALFPPQRPLADARTYNPPPALRVGYLGRLEPSKGIETLIHALERLTSAHPNVSLHIGGSGSDQYEKTCRMLIAQKGITDKVQWAGWIHDKAAFFAALDVLVVPSLSESFGLIILEAFANRVPVVATDTDGPNEIITPGVDGFIFPRGDVNTLADTLGAFIKRPQLCAELAHHAHNTLVAKYSADRYERALHATLVRETAP